jgi:hypothetical protein
VSRISEIDMDRQIADFFTGEPSAPYQPSYHYDDDTKDWFAVAMAVRDLMSATSSLSEMAAGKSTAGLVRIEANDIELAYTRLGRMLSHIRKPAMAGLD